MPESKRFRVLLKDKRTEYVTADNYSRTRLGMYTFTLGGKEVASFQIAEVVGIVDATEE